MIIIFAYAVQFMVLPAYSELEHRNRDRFAKASMLSTVLYTIAFLTVGVVGLLTFGSKIDADLLVSLTDIPGKVSAFCRFSFVFVLMCHIPYFFFTCKEYWLVIYDELSNRSMSQRLEAKLAQYLEKHQWQDDPSPPADEEERENLISQRGQNAEAPLSESGATEQSYNTNKSGLTYKKLPDSIFIWSAVVLWASLLMLAMTISSIEAIFDFIGAVCCGSCTLLFPGMGYLMALGKYGSERKRAKWSTTCDKAIAIIFLLSYVIVLALFFY